MLSPSTLAIREKNLAFYVNSLREMADALEDDSLQSGNTQEDLYSEPEWPAMAQLLIRANLLLLKQLLSDKLPPEKKNA